MRQLGIFAKYWQPGHVKTRLAADLGNSQAAAIYQKFVETLLLRLAGSAEQHRLAYSPKAHREAFAELLKQLPQPGRNRPGRNRSEEAHWQLLPQSEGDLGQRMQNFFSEAMKTSSQKRVVLLGSDSPNVPLEYVRQAFHLLEEAAVVLGPTSDGGYYLVGARDQVPPIFSRIDWSSSSVWQQTVDQLEKTKTSYRVLPSWYDVDTLSDLNHLQQDLAAERREDPHLAVLHEAIRVIRSRAAGA